jgi:hypothetical protein
MALDSTSFFSLLRGSMVTSLWNITSCGNMWKGQAETIHSYLANNGRPAALSLSDASCDITASRLSKITRLNDYTESKDGIL